MFESLESIRKCFGRLGKRLGRLGRLSELLGIILLLVKGANELASK